MGGRAHIAVLQRWGWDGERLVGMNNKTVRG